jgi:uncharacterized protein YidB (DUF937 family)
MPEVADRLKATRRQLMSRVRDALDDVAPEVAESAVGRVVQAGVLVELAAGLLSEQLGSAMACKLVGDLAQRLQAAGIDGQNLRNDWCPNTL